MTAVPVDSLPAPAGPDAFDAEPVLIERRAAAEVTDALLGKVLTAPRWMKPALAVSALGSLVLFAAIAYTVLTGIGTWGNNIPVGWAFGITNFVFWIGIGHAGTFISAFLLLAVEMRVVYPPGPGAAHAWDRPGWFLARAVLYLVVWCGLAAILQRASTAYDAQPTAPALARMRRWSAAGLPLLAFTLTFASFDWLMALQPGWVSDIFGLYVFAGGFQAAIALVVVLAWFARRRGAIPAAVGPAHFHALGRLLLTSVILWAYLAFFQLMLVWIADLPREVEFFRARTQGDFAAVDVILVLGRFVVPFLLLLSRPLKRRPGALAAVAAWLLIMSAVDLAWLALPAMTDRLRLLDLAPFVAVVGLALAVGVARFSARRDLPHHDPAMPESLRYESR